MKVVANSQSHFYVNGAEVLRIIEVDIAGT